MKNIKRFSILHYLIAVSMALVLGGCAGTTVAPGLLNQPHVGKPIVNKDILVSSPINQSIDRSEKVEESIKESLDIALDSAGLFKKGASQQYKLVATTQLFSQSPMSFGKFGNKLNVNYQLLDQNNHLILSKSIFTIAESDKWFFAGVKRAERARAVNIAKNVNQFMVFLRKKLR